MVLNIAKIIECLLKNAIRPDIDNNFLSLIDMSFMGIMNLIFNSKNK